MMTEFTGPQLHPVPGVGSGIMCCTAPKSFHSMPMKRFLCSWKCRFGCRHRGSRSAGSAWWGSMGCHKSITSRWMLFRATFVSFWAGAERARQLIWWEELRRLVRQQIATSGLTEPISALSSCPGVISISPPVCSLYGLCTPAPVHRYRSTQHTMMGTLDKYSSPDNLPRLYFLLPLTQIQPCIWIAHKHTRRAYIKTSLYILYCPCL